MTMHLDADGNPYWDFASAEAATIDQLDALKAYLGGVAAGDTYTDEQLSSLLAVETANQAAQIKSGLVVSDHPDLVEALFRRCARNLAARTVPLAIQEAADGAYRIGGRDPEIKRLEAPYRRLVVA